MLEHFFIVMNAEYTNGRVFFSLDDEDKSFEFKKEYPASVVRDDLNNCFLE